ncbi:MAG: DNA polymerase III subunit epsilon [Gammaproteobacteria bacterium BRH_c0]|nr:MAG: DNA polymerase III subunit epsilon [Gammaproteobacteria bacterium BRH_c0]
MAGKKPDYSRAAQWESYLAQQAGVCRTPVLKGFYAAGIPPADTPLAELPLVALDFETTGLDPHRHEILSVGLVPFTLAGIRPAEGYYQVVRPSGPLTEESIALHRITHSQVAQAPPLEQIIDELIGHLTGRVVVVHYRAIERPFLDLAATRLWGEHCLFPLIDTMAIEARWERETWSKKVRHWLGMRPASIRLGDSRQRYGLPAYSSHHAKVDAVATAELFMAQVARHYSHQAPVGKLWD